MDGAPDRTGRRALLRGAAACGIGLAGCRAPESLVIARAASAPGAASGRVASPARLGGTFLQPAAADAELDEAGWTQRFAEFERLGLTELVLQWSVSDDFAFHRPDPRRPHAPPLVDSVLRLAERASMRVWLGLVHQSDWWQAIAPAAGDPSEYLARLRARTIATAAELAPRANAHRRFAGWYLSEEIDDASWLEPLRAAALCMHLDTVSRGLRRLTPRAPIGLSGFVDARRMEPQPLAALWSMLLRRAPAIDVVFLQDGVGAGHVPLERLADYAGAMSTLATGRRTALRMVVELFEQVQGPPIDEGPFRAVPAAIERVAQQLDLAAAVDRRPLGFAVPNYMSAAAGPAAALLQQRYLARCGCEQRLVRGAS